MSDDLVYWKKALMGIVGPIHENDPQCGWFRTRPKRGYASFPVRIWRDQGDASLKALKAGKSINPCEVWTWCCMNPVSEDAYNDALGSGDPWPDGVPSSYRPSAALSPLAKASAIRLRHGERQSECGETNVPSSHATPLMPLMPKGEPTHMRKAQAGPIPKAQAGLIPKAQAANIETPNGLGTSGTAKERAGGSQDAQNNPKESQDDNRDDTPDASSNGGSQPVSHQGAAYPSIGHNSAKRIVVSDQSLPQEEGQERPSHGRNITEAKSCLAMMLDPFADSRQMSDHIALLWDEISSWLQENGPIAEQFQADRCANYASALSNLEALSEDMRVREKKPFLEACRSVDAKWKPVIEAAKQARSSCKNALEPFLVAEWYRIGNSAKREGDFFQPPRAGTYGRTISLRLSEKVVITDIHRLSAHYCHDERLTKHENFCRLLKQYAEEDMKAGIAVPGAKTIEERSIA